MLTDTAWKSWKSWYLYGSPIMLKESYRNIKGIIKNIKMV